MNRLRTNSLQTPFVVFALTLRKRKTGKETETREAVNPRCCEWFLTREKLRETYDESPPTVYVPFMVTDKRGCDWSLTRE